MNKPSLVLLGALGLLGRPVHTALENPAPPPAGSPLTVKEGAPLHLIWDLRLSRRTSEGEVMDLDVIMDGETGRILKAITH